ncbi:MAG: hypothetical protein A3J83_05115 [Elusimicrobia bacterium RIFOXYA2_FULL_40_6]|nr:MAG: hypothetical protein A3J83_05115 [Elusimicrobia bacterium RIFOXYA2_FULL_40_6]
MSPEEKLEVKQISEREYWVGENRIYFGEDDIIYVTAVGDADEKIAAAMKEIEIRFINMAKGEVSLLVDLNKCGKQSPEARKIRMSLGENSKIRKVAVFGIHPVAKIIASFVVGISKNDKLCFFKTKEEALAWLKGREEIC